MRSPHPLQAILGLALLLLVPTLILVPPTSRRARAERRDRTGTLQLAWVRHESPLPPTWPDQSRFTSDATRKPVISGNVVLLTSSQHDEIYALDRRTGDVRWRHSTDGPVRFAPAVWRDQVFLTSDDGYLYCVRISDGKRLWRFRGGPTDRLILGNERLISTWPARGGPVVVSEPNGRGTVYFAAGIWPFMGIFLHALDAGTGTVRWTNSGEGATFIKQPHTTDAFAGIAPQGSLVVSGDKLLVPGGRSTPACFDRHTGKRIHYLLNDSSKKGGGPDIIAGPTLYLNGGGAFETATGKFIGAVSEPVAISGTSLYSATPTQVNIHDISQDKCPQLATSTPSSKRPRLSADAWLGEPTSRIPLSRTTALAPAGERVYIASPGTIHAVSTHPEAGKPAVQWKSTFQGTPVHLVVDQDTAIISTLEGRIYAFTQDASPTRNHARTNRPLSPSNEARSLLAASGVREGYAVIWGIGDGTLITSLYHLSSLRLLVFDEDESQVRDLRERFRVSDIPGERISVRVGSPSTTTLPPYLASLVVFNQNRSSPELPEPAVKALVGEVLRPDGGVAAFPSGEGWATLRRTGGVSGSADWTHQHADAANTRVSLDRVVKAPLGVLWFGGPGNQSILPRHGHGPVPQVCQGRLMIEGPDRLRAIDIYTGRLLWETVLPGLGKAYDNTAHQPGANALGSNYVSTPEGVYVAYRNACLRLDLATGKINERFHLPVVGKTPPDWSFLTVEGNHLIAGTDALTPPSRSGKKTTQPLGASKRLHVLDRTTGKFRFAIDAVAGFRHNSICIGDGILFAIDRPATGTRSTKNAEKEGRVVAYNLASGKRLWEHKPDAFGTWLSYSTTYHVLVEAGLMARDTLADEAPGMRAFAGKSGKVLWHRPDYFGPALIRGNEVLKGGDARAGSGTACDLLSGEPREMIDPLTRTAIPWRWERTYGCNTPAASEHLVLFRSGAAGFYDLCNQGGTGNLGGFRSSCTLNLIAAGGVLTAPDYTRTCSCSYQNQTSVGFIHMPEAELWTFTTKRPIQGRVRQVGINFAAPGSRKAENGTLWIEHPPVGGPSPRLTISTTPATPASFRMHTSQVEPVGRSWVGASGLRGLSRIALTLGDGNGPRRYTIRMTFVEPDSVAAGQRKFDVGLQGKILCRALDIAFEAGGCRRIRIREFPGVVIDKELIITLTPTDDSAVRETLLSGVEVLPEGW